VLPVSAGKNMKVPPPTTIALAAMVTFLAVGCSKDAGYERAINAWADDVCACYRTGSAVPGDCVQKLSAPEFPYRATDNFIDNPNRPAETQARKRALECENAWRSRATR
jgi:hypothetical protein